MSEFSGNPRIADSIVGLHAQQAIEESVKAAMAVRGLDVPRTHDLDLLAERLEAAGVELPVHRDQLAELTAYAGPLRYEDLLDTDPLDRQGVDALVGEILGWSGRELESED